MKFIGFVTLSILMIQQILCADNSPFVDTDRCNKSSPVKFYYNANKIICYAVRSACYVGNDKLYDSEEECTAGNFPSGRRRTVSVACDVGLTPLSYTRSNGEKVAYLFHPDCDGVGRDFCPEDSYCYLGPHGYCCQKTKGRLDESNYGRYVFQKNFGNTKKK